MSDRKHKKCITCHNGVGPNSPGWKGGTYRKKGYVMKWTADRGYVFEHVLVMEGILGRYLEEGENVHHKNGVKDDNRPKNLELWVRPQPTGIRASDAIRWALEVLAKYGRNTDAVEDGQHAGSNPADSTRVVH